jgi:hypothetical protein
MSRPVLISVLALALAGATTIAFAQVGGNGEATPAVQPETHASECADEVKQGGAFGACVSERASAFGRCVADAAKAGNGSPTQACADLKPGNGNGANDDGNGAGNGNGNDNGNANGDSGNGEGVTTVAPSNPTDGVTRPPEQHGRDFGQQVADNARENAGGDAEARNPTEGVARPPEQAGRDFGQEVADNARGDGGPPEGIPGP